MHVLDRGGKLLLQRRPVEILRLTHPHVRRVRPVGGEVVTANVVADGAFLAREGGRDVVHQVEWVAEPGSQVAQRIARRTCGLFAAFARPVRVSVIYLHAAKDGRRPAAACDLPLGASRARVELRSLRVWADLSAPEELSRARPVLGWLPLVGLMKDTSLGCVARAAEAIRRRARSDAESADLQAALHLLSERRFTRRGLRDIISVEVLMESSLWREAEKKGKKEGERRARQKVLLRMLRQRFGRLPREARERVEAAPTTRLDRWLDRLLVAESLEDVFA